VKFGTINLRKILSSIVLFRKIRHREARTFLVSVNKIWFTTIRATIFYSKSKEHLRSICIVNLSSLGARSVSFKFLRAAGRSKAWLYVLWQLRAPVALKIIKHCLSTINYFPRCFFLNVLITSTYERKCGEVGEIYTSGLLNEDCIMKENRSVIGTYNVEVILSRYDGNLIFPGTFDITRRCRKTSISCANRILPLWVR
jgi:hypothetical protein